MIRLLLKGVICLAVLALLGAAVFVRTAPIPVKQVHLGSYPSGIGHRSNLNSHMWRTRQDADGVQQMEQWDKVIRATPRTNWVAGSVEDEMITYVIKSKWWRFPDYTTVQRNMGLIEGGPPVLSVSSRAYYGKLDFGVNERRLRGWLAQIEAGG